MRDDVAFIALVVLVFGLILWLVGRPFFRNAKDSAKRNTRREDRE